MAQSCCDLWNGSSWIRHIWCPWLQTQQSFLQRGLEHSISLPFSSYCCVGCCSYDKKPHCFWRAFEYWNCCLLGDVSSGFVFSLTFFILVI